MVMVGGGHAAAASAVVLGNSTSRSSRLAAPAVAKLSSRRMSEAVEGLGQTMHASTVTCHFTVSRWCPAAPGPQIVSACRAYSETQILYNKLSATPWRLVQVIIAGESADENSRVWACSAESEKSRVQRKKQVATTISNLDFVM